MKTAFSYMDNVQLALDFDPKARYVECYAFCYMSYVKVLLHLKNIDNGKKAENVEYLKKNEDVDWLGIIIQISPWWSPGSEEKGHDRSKIAIAASIVKAIAARKRKCHLYLQQPIGDAHKEQMDQIVQRLRLVQGQWKACIKQWNVEEMVWQSDNTL